MNSTLRRRAIDRLESIWLEPFAHEIVDMDPHTETVAEHIDWILTADAREIRSWHNEVFYRARD